jgi:hypothetical protein
MSSPSDTAGLDSFLSAFGGEPGQIADSRDFIRRYNDVTVGIEELKQRIAEGDSLMKRELLGREAELELLRLQKPQHMGGQ